MGLVGKRHKGDGRRKMTRENQKGKRTWRLFRDTLKEKEEGIWRCIRKRRD